MMQPEESHHSGDQTGGGRSAGTDSGLVTPSGTQLESLLASLEHQQRLQVLETFRKVEDYLARTESRYRPGEDEFFARIALEQALLSARDGNYGIGAVAVQKTDDGSLLIYSGRNGVVTSTEQTQKLFGPEFDLARTLVGHAETIALLRTTHTGITPDGLIPASEIDPDLLGKIETGIAVFGTLEACPMCTCVMTNDRRVTRSVSTTPDPPSAHSIGDAAREHQPPVWTAIQEGRNFHPQLLNTDDRELADLSQLIFSGTREAIDRYLASRSAN